ncbi:serine/threonine-protein kinase LMTK2-like [Synchiropus splendidus]|uniref:serine/threonine-protein kinase LMTK2-like n=1 Tax=Synchiropus splendidus TaxID=270530 RepID=UPI00237DC6E8|nr:serine/threonine-protein kinase LMTK2-like [Synchiropus splendidus]XP_053709508.1 serine/threonine-protein kinase LMTK2-like [Synchiropus splendidus]
MSPWEIFGFKIQGSLITDGCNMDTNKNIITIDNRIIFFPDKSKAKECFSDYWWTCPGNILCNSSINLPSDLESAPQKWSKIAGDTKKFQSKEAAMKEFNSQTGDSRLKSCEKPKQAEKLSRRSKRRRSVSFVDDVMVFVFDQECPTMELQGDSCTNSPPPCSWAEDCGLEWEDDFSALERSSRLQPVSQHHSVSPATKTWTLLSERLFLPQNCLCLTHVSEADLEL